MIIEEDRIKKNENKDQYVYRLAQKYIESGEMTWDDLANIINEGLGLDEESYLSASTFRKPYQNAVRYYKNVFSKIEENNSDNDLVRLKQEIKEERQKLNTEKIEYNKWIREKARDDLIAEKIEDSIKSLEPLEKHDVIINDHNHNKEYVLVFGDEHYNSYFQIKGLNGEILNEYSPEICEERMWKLLDDVVEICIKEGVTTLNVFNMGDFTDGLLRVSQIRKLRYGNIEGTIKFSNFLCEWLNKLTNYVNVKYSQVNGNHDELRMLGQPKGTFKEDNMGLVVAEFVKVRMKDNPNFEFIENPTGLIFNNFFGFNVLGIHGEVKNMEEALKDFSKLYHVNIDFLLAGHLHHNKNEEVGYNCEVINVGSVIGIDPYSISLNKSSSASAKMFVFVEDEGKKIEYTFKLN